MVLPEIAEPTKQGITYQDINVGLINVWWDNGSFQVPDEPPKTNNFTKLSTHCIEWKSSLCGNIQVKGDYNYAVVDDKFYFMSKVSPINDTLDEWIYLLTFDIWNNYKEKLKITGDIIRTNDEKIIRENIHLVDPITTKYDSEEYFNIFYNLPTKSTKFLEIEEWPFYWTLSPRMFENVTNWEYIAGTQYKNLKVGQTYICQDRFLYNSNFGINYLVQNIYNMIEEVIKNKGYKAYFIKKYSGEKTIINQKINEDDYFIISTQQESPLGSEVLINNYLHQIDFSKFKNAAFLDPDLSYTPQNHNYREKGIDYNQAYYGIYLSPTIIGTSTQQGPTTYRVWGVKWGNTTKTGDDVGFNFLQYGPAGVSQSGMRAYNLFYKNGDIINTAKHLFKMKNPYNDDVLENSVVTNMANFATSKNLHIIHNSKTDPNRTYDFYWRTEWDGETDHSLNYIKDVTLLKLMEDPVYSDEEKKAYEEKKLELEPKIKTLETEIKKLQEEIATLEGQEGKKQEVNEKKKTRNDKIDELEEKRGELDEVTKQNPLLKLLKLTGGCFPVCVISKVSEGCYIFSKGVFCLKENCNWEGGDYTYPFDAKKMKWFDHLWYFIPLMTWPRRDNKPLTINEEYVYFNAKLRELGVQINSYDKELVNKCWTYNIISVLHPHLLNSWSFNGVDDRGENNSKEFFKVFCLERKVLPTKKRQPHLRLKTGQYFDFSGLWKLEGTKYYIYYYLKPDNEGKDQWEWDLIIPKEGHLGYMNLESPGFSNENFDSTIT